MPVSAKHRDRGCLAVSLKQIEGLTVASWLERGKMGSLAAAEGLYIGLRCKCVVSGLHAVSWCIDYLV